MYPFRFQRSAAREHEKTIEYHEKQRPGLGGDYRHEVETAVYRICNNPHAGAIYGRGGYRYSVVRRFRYVLFYKLIAGTIWFMAVAHPGRKPNYWRGRKLI